MAPLARVFHSYLVKQAKLYSCIAKQGKVWLKSYVNHPGTGQNLGRAEASLQPAFAKSTQHPIPRLAFLRQSKRGFHTGYSAGYARTFTSGTAKSGAKYSRASFPQSRVATAVNASSGRAPFASTLRPNLTGGTLGRTAGGYAYGAGRGGARYFSHTPAAQAQVVQNVSQAVRAFFVSGQKAQFDGVHPRTGEKQYKAVTTLQEAVGRKVNQLPKATPGSFIDFTVNPTITALTPLSAVAGFTAPALQSHSLNTDGLLDVLSVDFSRALKDLAVILNDLKRLSSLGDLPITYRDASLRVHFPGCDADTVERLCDELGIMRGSIGQDEDFDAFAGTEIALLFPFAPSGAVSECSLYDEPPMRSRETSDFWLPDSPRWQDRPVYSDESDSGLELQSYDISQMTISNPWISSPSVAQDSGSELQDLPPSYEESLASHSSPLEYQGFEGIYRFIEHLDAADRR